MRMAFVFLAAVVTLFVAVDASADPNVESKLSAPNTLLNTDNIITNHRHLRVESATDVDDEERAFPSWIANKIKLLVEKAKLYALKLSPFAVKLTDRAMAGAVRRKPEADRFIGKLKPIADKFPKPVAAMLKEVPVVKKVNTKLTEFVQKVKNTKVGEATVGERKTMAKFDLWFEQNKNPDDIKKLLKIGPGATDNTKNYDLWVRYKAYYSFAQREKELKAKVL